MIAFSKKTELPRPLQQLTSPFPIKAPPPLQKNSSNPTLLHKIVEMCFPPLYQIIIPFHKSYLFVYHLLLSPCTTDPAI